MRLIEGNFINLYYSLILMCLLLTLITLFYLIMRARKLASFRRRKKRIIQVAKSGDIDILFYELEKMTTLMLEDGHIDHSLRKRFSQEIIEGHSYIALIRKINDFSGLIKNKKLKSFFFSVCKDQPTLLLANHYFEAIVLDDDVYRMMVLSCVSKLDDYQMFDVYRNTLSILLNIQDSCEYKKEIRKRVKKEIELINDYLKTKKK